MIRIYKISASVVTLFVAISCTEWLDIQPESEIVLEDFWQNESQVNQVLAACYRSLTEGDVISRMLVWGELRSDNVTFGYDVPDDMQKILNVDISPKNDYNHWGSFYAVINVCNNFLYNAPGVVDADPNFTESKLHALETEVLTIRALAYFYLVRTFKKVPWIENPSIDDTQDYAVADTTSEFILGNIVTDLNTALLFARDKFENDEYNKGRITKNAVRALLADIYLWQDEYEKCVQACDDILTDTEQNLLLVDGNRVIPEVFYKGNSSESIFELQFDDITQFNWVLRDYYGFAGNYAGYWSFPGVLVTGVASPFNFQAPSRIESKEDLREKDFIRPEIGGDRYFVFKYAGALREENPATGYSSYIYRSTTANWIIYRLPDIMLMKAEALIQLERNSEALELINTTYLRSNPELADGSLKIEDYNSKLEMEKLLLRERQRELMFEGKRWFDLMRLARRADSPAPLLNYVLKKYTGTATVQATKMSVMDALYLPIHSDELKANSALEQNPFYELSGESTN